MNENYKNIAAEIEQRRIELECTINQLIHEFENTYDRYIYCHLIPQSRPLEDENGNEIIIFPTSNTDKAYLANRCSIKVFKNMHELTKQRAKG